MTDCIFCKIVKGELPRYKIYEDKDFLAFLDLSQIVNGHTLLIPKKHCRWVWEIENLGNFFAVAKKIVNKMQQVTGKEFVASMMFGVMIEHAHLHLLPTTKGSVQRVWDAWEEARGMRKLKPDQLEKIAKKFRLN